MATFADFSKAFDMVDHTRTLEKSAQNGFPKALSTLDSKFTCMKDDSLHK